VCLHTYFVYINKYNLFLTRYSHDILYYLICKTQFIAVSTAFYIMVSFKICTHYYCLVLKQTMQFPSNIKCVKCRLRLINYSTTTTVFIPSSSVVVIKLHLSSKTFNSCKWHCFRTWDRYVWSRHSDYTFCAANEFCC